MRAGSYQRKDDVNWLKDRRKVLNNKTKHQMIKGSLVAIEDESVFQNWLDDFEFEDMLYLGATGIYYQSK